MTPEDVLALAREGHPKVIATIMNRSTRDHGIRVRVARKGQYLHVLMEGDAIANHELMTAFVKSSFEKLKVNPDLSVKVYGRKHEHRSVAWSKTFEMATIYSSDAPLAAAPATAAKRSVQASASHPAQDNLTVAADESNRMDRDTVGSEPHNFQPNTESSTYSAAVQSTPDAFEDAIAQAEPSTAEPSTHEASHAQSSEAQEHAVETPQLGSPQFGTPHVGSPEPQPMTFKPSLSDSESLSADSQSSEDNPSQEASEELESTELGDRPEPAEPTPVNPLPVASAESLDTQAPPVESLSRGSPSPPDQPSAKSPDEPPLVTDSSMTDPTTNPANPSTPAFEASPAVSFDEPDRAEAMPDMEFASDEPDLDVPEEFNQDESDLEQFDFQEMASHPEALVLILFAIALYIWQIYTALIEAAAPEGSVSGHELAQRLGVNQSKINRRKYDDDFIDWSASLDPDGIAWSYSQGAFVPQIPDFNA